MHVQCLLIVLTAFPMYFNWCVSIALFYDLVYIFQTVVKYNYFVDHLFEIN